MYDRILVPTDRSRSADTAARHGHMLAEAFGASVHIVSAVEDRERGELPHPTARLTARA
jgi:nucleotide-binding universal stress UspA family protein